MSGTRIAELLRQEADRQSAQEWKRLWGRPIHPPEPGDIVSVHHVGQERLAYVLERADDVLELKLVVGSRPFTKTLKEVKAFYASVPLD